MALVYPIYLDTPMMTAFLASLEGGIIEEANLEGRSTSAEEEARSASIGAKVSKLISGFLDIEGKGEFAKRVSDSLESQYKSTVRFPNASLFVRLRDLLLEQKLVKALKTKDDFEAVTMGDLVEFQGLARPNPAHQLRRAFGQLLPLLEPYQEIQVNQLEQKLTLLKSAKPGQSIDEDDARIVLKDQAHIKALRESIQGKQNEARLQLSFFNSLGKVLSGLFPQDDLDTLVFQSDNFNCVAHVYSAFARNERLQDICDGHWYCLGKVIGIVKGKESYDLLKGSPINYLARSQFPALARSLRNEEVNIETTEPEVLGPAVIVATLAIFA